VGSLSPATIVVPAKRGYAMAGSLDPEGIWSATELEATRAVKSKPRLGFSTWPTGLIAYGGLMLVLVTWGAILPREAAPTVAPAAPRPTASAPPQPGLVELGTRYVREQIDQRASIEREARQRVETCMNVAAGNAYLIRGENVDAAVTAGYRGCADLLGELAAHLGVSTDRLRLDERPAHRDRLQRLLTVQGSWRGQ
jgi:hypothetical protein